MKCPECGYEFDADEVDDFKGGFEISKEEYRQFHKEALLSA